MSPDAAVHDEGLTPLEFVSEDDLLTLTGWAKYQGFDLAALTEEEAAEMREMFEEATRRHDTARRVGRMKLKARPGEFRYAVAIRDGAELLLTLWVRRSPKGEFFVFQPRGDRDWNPHTSLHVDGTFHMKSRNQVTLPPQQRQRPDSIKASECLGAYGGHGPKSVGAICDPQDFNGVFEVPPGILGPRNGQVVVDLLADERTAPLQWPGEEVARSMFTAVVPYVLIRIFRT